jgi:ketosteroid isomerase-like protein
MSEQDKQTVLKFIHAMGASDPDGAAACLNKDAFTVSKGFGKFAGHRPYDTMLGTISAFNQLLPTGLRPIIHNVMADGDKVIVEWEGDALTSAGEKYNNQYCFIFRMRDGRISEVTEYFCNVLADRVLWPLVEPMAAQIPTKDA